VALDRWAIAVPEIKVIRMPPIMHFTFWHLSIDTLGISA
jgi:hypothetical protein